MNPKTSHKMIAAGGVAIAVIAIAAYMMRSKSDAPVAQTSQAPAPATEVPAAVPAAVTDAVAPTQDAPPTVASTDGTRPTGADTTPAVVVDRKPARNRQQANTGPRDVAARGPVARAAPVVDPVEAPAPASIASSVSGVSRADEVTQTEPKPASISGVGDDRKIATSTDAAASDGQITLDVKSAIASDSFSKDFNIGVTTTHGIVALTGKLASQDAIDQVKGVAGKVKDVKSVDTSALLLASL
jgi:hyperosmotically inducible protein